ncbi:MAG: ribosomal-processing cysteine protease Prp [Erysipelotrichia bacterium]|nr:ribosomal-processing cysteine protease Prp [Erysipelotrichia bacterium]NCC54374.1 ribosomal-processing cysteine protease Prp [Erysipelotrichia bacterium]
MVKVEVVLQKQQVKEITVKNHANSGEYGQDLVCAGVSCITFGILNTLNELYENACDLIVNEAYVKIVNKEVMNENVQTILKTMYIQLLTMEKKYGKYIKLMKVEV